MAQVNSPQTEPSPAVRPESDVQTQAPGALQASPASSDSPADFAHLFHMSPTAGVGTTDYAAINSLAIVALLLGLGSVAALTSNVMLLIPLAGIVCSVVAFRQIVQSNGTQAGKSFAAIGLIASLSLGAGTLGARLLAYRHTVDDQRLIAQELANIGDDIIQDRLPQLYSKVTDRFKSRVSQEAFVNRVGALQNPAQIGKLTAIRWNEEPMFFEGEGDGSGQIGTAMAVLTFAKVPDLNREIFSFVKRGDHWVLDNIPQLFPPEHPKKGAPRPGSPNPNVKP